MLRHLTRWNSPRHYHYTIPYRYIYWNQWIRYRVTDLNGYRLYNGYPFFVFNGYRHRYSSYDQCNYDLVDGNTNSVQRTFSGYTCKMSYDMCADVRDNLNADYSSYRYFCAEEFEYDENFRYDWNYNDDFYSDVDTDFSDSDEDYYNDDDDYDYDDYGDYGDSDWD